MITDVEMKDPDAPAIATVNIGASQTSDLTNFTPDDELLEDERAAYQSDTFEFGQIPSHAPSREFC